MGSAALATMKSEIKLWPAIGQVIVGVVAVFATSCTGLVAGARSAFGHHFSCPDERIAVRQRDDLHDSLVTDSDRRAALQTYPVESEPSPDVAQDPGRLAKWKADQEEAAERRKHLLDGMHENEVVFEVSGCGQTELLTCRNLRNYRGTPTGEVRCAAPPE